MEFEFDRFLEKISNKINPNPKRKMTVDMQRKLTRASIAFDKIENTIRKIDYDLDYLIKKNKNHSCKDINTITFIKKNISNQYYQKKINTCRNYIEAFKREFDDTLIDERILKSFGWNRIKLVFLPEINGLVKKLEHSLHVKEKELINSGKIMLELDDNE